METELKLSQFAIDISNGLTSMPKHLGSKYFYDAKGSRIFQKIMQMPEYYLTSCEEEIFLNQKHLIYEVFSQHGKPFEMVELGAGDGMKTKILLNYFLQRNSNLKYIPVDISEKAVVDLVNELETELPTLDVNGKVGDYFQLINELSQTGKTPKILLFLGSNIGNFNEPESIRFFKQLKEIMNPDDMLFIGFDLKKDPEVILKAYNDPYGYTSSFNLNLLRRINEDLGADFELLKFDHHEVYDPQTGTAKSYLVSKDKQSVYIHDLNQTIEFDKWETIYMEMSQKYDMKMIRDLANNSGFEVVRNFYDKRQYYMNSVWKLKN
ncbi:MAG: L-histidine N(alpha)-methyltransferase [Bacteroidales bacterium]|nr:L-histidine N(alpha)-methyltransferase [Bacteroidales bacterium]MCF8402568.1 L-histidine N(alpha)-methyltransferase [Bacteroidales bacterium]